MKSCHVLFQINVRKKKGQSETLTTLGTQDTWQRQIIKKKTQHRTLTIWATQTPPNPESNPGTHEG